MKKLYRLLISLLLINICSVVGSDGGKVSKKRAAALLATNEEAVTVVGAAA